MTHLGEAMTNDVMVRILANAAAFPRGRGAAAILPFLAECPRPRQFRRSSAPAFPAAPEFRHALRQEAATSRRHLFFDPPPSPSIRPTARRRFPAGRPIRRG